MTSPFPIEKAGHITDLALSIDWPPEELRRQVQKRAARLRECGVGSGKFCLLLHDGTPHYFADLLAVWETGACAVPLNPALTPREFGNIAGWVKPSLVLAGPGKKLPKTQPPVPLLYLDDEEGGRSTPVTGNPAKPDDPALVLFTSGATGKPKGVVHTFRSVNAKLTRNQALLPGEAWQNTLCVLPAHFVAGLLGGSLPALAQGKRVFLFQNPGVTGARRLGEVIDRHGITFLNSGPSFWKLVLKTSVAPKPGVLRHVAVCSALLAKDLWENIMIWSGTNAVSNRYGTTETAGWDTCHSAASGGAETGLVGNAVLGEAAVLSDEGTIKTEGEGELLLKSPAMMQGYFRQPALTESAFFEKWYRTGDFASIDGGGKIRILGRTQSFINRAGIKILPEEIDVLIERFPGVEEACAFGIPDAVSGETVGIALVCGKGASTEVSRLRAWCAERIRPECVPERWFFVSAIPRNERGKINRDMVREYCLGEGRVK